MFAWVSHSWHNSLLIISHTCNFSFITGIIQSKLKLGKLSLIYTKGDPSLMTLTYSSMVITTQKWQDTFTVELTKIHKWLQVHKLSINIHKTNYMIFRSQTKHKAPKINITIAGKILEIINQTTFIGVLMDESLSWKVHVNHVASKVAKCEQCIFTWQKQCYTMLLQIHTSPTVIMYREILLWQAWICCLNYRIN